MENDNVKLKNYWPLWIKIGVIFVAFILLFELYAYAWFKANEFDSSTNQFAWPEWARKIFSFPSSEGGGYGFISIMAFFIGPPAFFFVISYFVLGAIIHFFSQKIKTRKATQ